MKRSFSPSDAASEGFRIIQRYPGAVAIWTGLYLILALAGLFLVRAMVGPDLAAAMTASRENAHDPTAAMAMMSHMGPLILVASLFGILIHAVYSTAVYRAVLRPDDKGFGFLKLGADEFRQIGLYLYICGVVLLAYLALIVVVVLVALVLGIAAGATGHGGGVGALGGLGVGLALVLAYLAFICAAIWVAVRFSLAPAATFARKRIQLFSAWRLTKGNFWSILGCYILVVIFVALVAILSWVVSVSVSAVVTGDWTPLRHVPNITDPKTMMSTITTGLLIQTLVSALFGAVLRAIQLAPAGAIYRELGAEEDLSDFKVRANGLVL